MENLVSIIVPVYKAESSISRCIESILAQTHKNVELILVDDGSPDGSGEICLQYAKQDDRVRYFKKENGGVASARNFGLSVATGEFVQFVDSDDYILLDMTNSLLSKAIENDAQMVICGFDIISRKGKTKKSFGNYLCVGKDEIAKCWIENFENSILNSVWTKLYKRSILLNEMESKYPVGEDLMFNVANISLVDRLVVIDECFYVYDCTRESLTRSNYKLNKNIIDDLFNAIEKVFLEVYNVEKLSKVVRRKHINYLIKDFLNQEQKKFTQREEVKNFFSDYEDIVKIIEPNTKELRYLQEKNYGKLANYFFARKSVQKVKNFLKNIIRGKKG